MQKELRETRIGYDPATSDDLSGLCIEKDDICLIYIGKEADLIKSAITQESQAAYERGVSETLEEIKEGFDESDVPYEQQGAWESCYKQFENVYDKLRQSLIGKEES